jgi:shikimate kinase
MIEAARRLIEAGQHAGRVRVIYLECDVPELIRRLSAAPGDRPSLTGEDVAGEVAAVLRRREPTYRALADALCDASGSDRQVVVDAVMEVMGLTGPGRQGEADPGGGEGKTDADADSGGR